MSRTRRASRLDPLRRVRSRPLEVQQRGLVIGLSLSIELGIGTAGNATRSGVSARSPESAMPAARPKPEPNADPGTLRRVSLRFRDRALEREYQRLAGAESLAAFRITTGTAAAMWFLAAIVIPIGTSIPLDRAYPVCAVLALVNWTAFLYSSLPSTLDRQHLIVSVLTSVNGLVIL